MTFNPDSPEFTIFSLSSKPSLQREQNMLEVLEDIMTDNGRYEQLIKQMFTSDQRVDH